MIVLGIDPGIATLGYGVVEKDKNGKFRAVDYGVVVTPKEQPLPARLALLEKGIEKILDQFHPDEIAIEELFFSKNITTGIAVAHARGVALLACSKHCEKLYEYTPMQIKQALTGYGKADKKQMQLVVTSLLGLSAIPKPDDAADALAVALCHGSTSRFGNLFAVGNTTRTKGKNTVTGAAFQSMMAEQGKKGETPKKPALAKTATGKAAKTASKTPQKTTAAKPTTKKPTEKKTPAKVTGAGTGNSAAAIAKAMFDKYTDETDET